MRAFVSGIVSVSGPFLWGFAEHDQPSQMSDTRASLRGSPPIGLPTPKDRDLYVVCANAFDGIITASPSSNGENLRDFAPGETVMQTATEGIVKEITYWWPRPGSIMPLKKHTFYTKVADQICGAG